MEIPSLRVVYWGTGPAVDTALAADFAAHARDWQREEDRRRHAEDVGNLVAAAILAGEVSDAAVVALLVTAPPPAPTLRRRIAVAIRAVIACFPSMTKEHKP